MSTLETISHESDICVVGGGMAGICAAIAAARAGSSVTLVQDRPVLGGNASEEIRMWICGAFGANMRETGIIEELELENIYRNPHKNYAQWNALLHDFVTREPNINLLLNASVLDATMEGAREAGGAAAPDGTHARGRIASVRAWQLTTQCFHTVAAKLFLDCSGDSILAPLTGAEHRWGRESKDEFGESHAADVADRKTMGMSCLIQLRETREPQAFVPPAYAHRYERDDIGPGRD
ncbi:MAG: FAD-dependent oxidoreductase, partial [Spirochaetota bacterium]